MINICSKKPKIYKPKNITGERNQPFSCIQRLQCHQYQQQKIQSERGPTRKSKELTNTIRQLALTAGKCLTRAYYSLKYVQDICFRKDGPKTRLCKFKDQKLCKLISETVMGQCLEVRRPRAIHNSYEDRPCRGRIQSSRICEALGSIPSATHQECVLVSGQGRLLI